MQQLSRTTLLRNERGATLVVSLILLVLISLLGVNSMKNAIVAEKMSAADHQRNITFQASESAANLALDDSNRSFISDAIIAAGPVPKDVDINSADTATTVTFTPVGSSALLGTSIGPNGATGQRVMVTSTATLNADPRASSETVHGIVITVPGT